MHFNPNVAENVPTGGNHRAWCHNDPDRTALAPVDDDALMRSAAQPLES